MGGSASGAINTSGFAECINQRQLPAPSHITHAGVYNEQFFEVGYRANKLMELAYGVGVSNCNLYGIPDRNYFLSLFMKSNKDGAPRTNNINLCIALDVSGSMGSGLSKLVPGQKSRLSLAQDAIWMMFQKLNPKDIFSMIIFHTQARTVIASDFVGSMDKQAIKNGIFSKFQSGGTTIKEGFKQSLQEINKKRSQVTGYEHRIVMLTDVCDNSVETQQQLIADIAENSHIGTTIIGVSSDFRSQTCQKLKEVKKFNYLSAVNDNDLNLYLNERFDYTFFPCAQNIRIKISSEFIQKIQVFGTPDEGREYLKEGDKFIVTRTNNMFPSELTSSQNDPDKIQSCGGLILVKFTPKQKLALPKIDLKIFLEYQDMDGHKFNQQYVVNQNVSAEEFYSDSSVKKGASLFYYTQSIRNLLTAFSDKNVTNQMKQILVSSLKRLFDYCPNDKHEQLKNIIQIAEQKEIKPPELHEAVKAH